MPTKINMILSNRNTTVTHQRELLQSSVSVQPRQSVQPTNFRGTPNFMNLNVFKKNGSCKSCSGG